ncbi:SDR family NAD(P)-dependent oxidoreductase [Rhodococcus sp. NPDC056960]|uniref:SDR family NAD(P)-dependent oxidoreductase n=1 Tax=Rhodococcus sp. NPDC056960 TaxID=3345982 RepID=UPI00363CFB26
MDPTQPHTRTPPSREKLVLVTGVEHPEGAHVARTLGEHGFDVIAHGFTLDAAEQIAGEITGNGGRASAAVADLTLTREVDRLFTAIENTRGGLGAVIHAAWLPGPESAGAPLQTIHPSDWDRMIQAHLGMLFTTVRRAIRSIGDHSGAGSIVTVTGVGRSHTETQDSTLVRQVIDGAIEAFTTAAAQDMSTRTVQINALQLLPERAEPHVSGEPPAPELDTALLLLADSDNRDRSGTVLSAHAALPVPVH